MYQWIQTDSNDTDPYRVITHDLNSDKIILQIDKLIQLISDNCGLGQNFYSNNKINKTATEILVDNQTQERSIKRSIVYIKNQIKQLCKILLYIGKFYNGLNELSYGDDIVIDIKLSDEQKERYEKEQLRQDVIDGIIPKEVYIQKYYPDLNINEIQDNNKLT